MLSPRDLVLLIVVMATWGFNLIASKVGVTEMPPVLFTGLRFLLLGAVTFPLLRIYRGQMRTLLIAVVSSGAVQFALLFSGLALAGDVSTVAIATQLGVPITTLLSVWLLKEKIRWRRILGICLAFGGVVIISFDPSVLAYWEGLVLVIASCVFGSLGVIYVKRLNGISPFELQAWIAMTSWPPLLLFSLVAEEGQWDAIRQASGLAWGAVAFTALVSSLLAHSGMYYLIKRYPVTSVAPLTLLSPIFGIAFGVALLDDELTSRILLGGAITLAGVFIVALRDRRMVDTGT